MPLSRKDFGYNRSRFLVFTKSNWLITSMLRSFGFSLLIWGTFHRFLLNDGLILLKSWTSTCYFSNSTGSFVTSSRFALFIGNHCRLVYLICINYFWLLEYHCVHYNGACVSSLPLEKYKLDLQGLCMQNAGTHHHHHHHRNITNKYNHRPQESWGNFGACFIPVPPFPRCWPRC